MSNAPDPSAPPSSPSPVPDREAIKRHLIVMVSAVAGLDVVAIAAYYALHLNNNPGSSQNTFVGIWILVSLAIVFIQQRKIRRARFGPRPGRR